MIRLFVYRHRHRPGWLFSRLLPGWLLGLVLLSGGSCSREAEDPPPEQRAESVDAKELSRPFGLQKVSALPHAEVTRRLGAHRMEAHTEWQISPPSRAGVDVALVTLSEDALLETDRAGNLHVLSDNDHGYGFEAMNTDGTLYVKMRYGPFIRRRPDPDAISRLEAAAGSDSAALLEVLAPFTEVRETTPVQVAGQKALRLVLARRAEPLPRPKKADGEGPGRTWRAATAVSALSGTAVVDGQRGVLLGLRLTASFTAPRASVSPVDRQDKEDHGAAGKEALVYIDVNHRMSVGIGDIGGEGGKIAAPAESIEEPVRPRPMLDQKELLDGLVPDPGSRRP